MRKNVIMGNLAIKSVAFTLLLSSVSLTGCYKDQRLDVNDPNTGTVVVPAAAYSISGTVTDFETGAPVECTVKASKGKVSELGNGAYNVSLTKEDVGEGLMVELTFEADNYVTTKRSVYVQKISDGSTIVYPVSVSLKKVSTPVEYVDVEYNLDLVFLDKETGKNVDVNYTIEGDNTLTNGNYSAGDYFIISPETEKYKRKVIALSLPEAKVEKGENNVITRKVVVELEPVTVAPTPDEYITITGTIMDKDNKLAKAQVVKVNGTTVEPKYNVYYFSFNVNKKEAKNNTLEVEAQILNANGTDIITASHVVNNVSEINGKDLVLKFPCAVKDGQEYKEGDDATGSINPDIEDGVVTETINNIMSDGTTILLNKGTVVTNLGDQNLILVRNTAEEENSSDATAVIRSYIGYPEGTTFNPALEVMFADIYGGEFGDNFELQYLGEDGTWTTDSEGSVSFDGKTYTMNVPHFSKFRAAMKYNTEYSTTTLSNTEVVEIGRMNNDEYPLNDFELRYNGKAGSKYADYNKIVEDVNANFSNEYARALVLNTIKGICPDAKEEFGTQIYVGYTNIPGWTLLNNADVTTTTETVTYTVTVNGKSISFAVETIKSVEISATEKNMTHIGHSHDHGHGHGDDLNNAGGGIIIGE